MDSVFESRASATPPVPPENPSFGHPIGGSAPTQAGDWFFYMITQELCNLAAMGSAELDHTKVNQAATAILELFTKYSQTIHAWEKGQSGAIKPILYSPTVELDFGASNNFAITPSLGGSLILTNPVGVVGGQTGFVLMRQDATGGRNLAYGSNFRFISGIVPILTAAPNALDIFIYCTLSSTEILGALMKDVKAAS